MANRDNRADCITYSVILRYVLNSLRCTVKDWQGYELAQKGILGLEPIKAHMDTTGQMIQLETQMASARSVLNNPAYHSTEVRGCTGTGAPPPTHPPIALFLHHDVPITMLCVHFCGGDLYMIHIQNASCLQPGMPI